MLNEFFIFTAIYFFYCYFINCYDNYSELNFDVKQ
jgi:hypothetical protein